MRADFIYYREIEDSIDNKFTIVLTNKRHFMRKDLSYLKKSRWLLLTIFSLLLGSNSMWAEAGDYTVNFDGLTALPEGWEAIETTVGFSYGAGTYEIGSDYKRTGKGLYTYQTSYAGYIVTIPVTGEVSFYVRARATKKACGVKVFKFDGTNFSEITEAAHSYTSSNTNTSWTQKIFTLSEGTRIAFQLNNAVIDDIVAEKYVQADGPALVVKDGTKVTSPYSYNFGLATAGTTKTFTLSNPGTVAVEGLSVSETGSFGATLSATTIAAGDEATLTITMPSTTGSSKITISSTTTGIEDFVINASGTVKDPNKMFEDFSGNTLPDGWTMAGNSYSWSFTNSYASYGGYSTSSSGTLTTKKLTFTAGEQFCFDAKSNATFQSTSAGFTVQTSTDGITFTNLETITSASISNSTWNSFVVTIPSDDVRYVRFANCIYTAIDNVYGGNLPLEPNMKFSAADYKFGMISAPTTSTTFTIQNTGLGELTGLSVTCDNSNFTISDVATTIAGNSEATFNVTMSNDTKGAQNGKVTVSADGFDAVEFNVSGYVLDNDVIIVDFAGNTIPQGWINNGFTVSNDEISTAYYTRTLTSPAITVADGQKLAIYAKGNSTYYASLTVKVSTDNGNTFTTAKEFTTEIRNNTTDYEVLIVDNIAAGNYILQFEGYQVTINTINGYTYNMNAPAMAFTAEDFAAGVVTANATKTYSVSNSGTGTLTVNIASDNEKFTVEPAQLVITDTPQDFTVTFNYTDGVFGKFNANITVTPTYDETAAVTFAASAQVKNPDLWDEDFESGSLPTGWVANNWNVGTFSSYENQTNMALAPQSSTAGTLITPCLTAKEGDVLTWDAYLNWYDEALIVEYSDDEQATWNQIYNYKTQDDTDAPSTSQRNYHKAMSFTAPADGNYYLRFTSTYQNGVDNFSGFKLNLPDHIMAITASNIPTSGSFSPSMKATKSFEATVTVKESRGVKEENVVAKLYMGTEVIGTSETVTVEANETKQITITATPTIAATEGVEMHIEVEFAGGTLTTTPETRYVAELVKLELTETDSKEIQTGYSAVYDEVTLTRSFANGWNTFIAPAEVSLSDIHENAIAYSFSSFNNNELGFTRVTSTNLSVATPYIIYVPEDVTRTFTWDSPVIYSTYVGEENIKLTRGEATFQGTYAPMTAGQLEGKYGVVPSTGKVQKGGASATMKGFRGYFTLPAGVEGARLSFTDVTTGITTVMDASELGNDAFNLKGQRVDTPKKGSLYIIGGKKVIVK